MAAKTETPVSQFNLPKGAPFVPTKVPKLPKPTGQKRLETTQQPRQVGVQTPLEQAAAVRQAAPATLPTSTTAAPTLPGVGTAATGLPYVPSAPAPEFAAMGYGGGQEGATPEETVKPEAVSQPLYGKDGEQIGVVLPNGHKYYNIPVTDPNHPDYVEPYGGDPTGGEPPDPYAGDYMLTAPDGTEYDARDKDSPFYDEQLDPTSENFNSDKFASEKGWGAVGAGSDEAYQNQFDSMDAEAAKAAAAAKRQMMARYGQAGFAGSGQYMQEMGGIDQAIWAANETAKADIMVEKMAADRQADIDRITQRLQYATGEESNKLQETLQQMLIDQDKEEALMEIFWASSGNLKELFGADTMESESWAQYSKDLEAAQATGSALAMAEVSQNIHYVDGVLYYRSEWGDPLEGYVSEDGIEYNSFLEYMAGNLGDEYMGGGLTFHDLFESEGWTGTQSDLMPIRMWLVQNGMDPDYAQDIIDKYGKFIDIDFSEDQ